MLINIGAEINIMQKSLTKKVNLLIIATKWVAKKNIRNINNRITKFMRIVTKINVKVDKISINSIIFMVKNN